MYRIRQDNQYLGLGEMASRCSALLRMLTVSCAALNIGSEPPQMNVMPILSFIPPAYLIYFRVFRVHRTYRGAAFVLLARNEFSPGYSTTNWAKEFLSLTFISIDYFSYLP
ncbi:hypothetical protein OCU04_004064 [Sclerotinia nivalis]|uniref:Uncharacterized protein n=1 Tax=Sclerotinia nivalis TaxID=352851 RepID=A0A9X0ATY7_9HELO|nr:hypothetical protein OCU04_004064 [Sclerotinia nivalis]